MNEIAKQIEPSKDVGAVPDHLLNVLFLDDQDADRMRLMRNCAKSGLKFKALEASDLKGFREILDEQSVDLVFLDYYLDMDTGLDALKILTQHEDQTHAIPIMVTSVDRHDIAVEAMRNGCADYITKEELSPDSLRKAVSSAFERHVLIAAIGQSQTSRAAIRMSMKRIANTCGPEMRSALAGTLRYVRGLRNTPDMTQHVSDNLTTLERSFTDIYGFLDEIDSLLEYRSAASERGRVQNG
ncbi:response regulator [Celeribacter sp. SCSIO 80788]|uniref:response regulator n=1 Tax=Celeribacter sp. SCSIO 80788 TaxID=3117013 RepID=UPI003DA3D36D